VVSGVLAGPGFFGSTPAAAAGLGVFEPGTRMAVLETQAFDQLRGVVERLGEYLTGPFAQRRREGLDLTNSRSAHAFSEPDHPPLNRDE
jgi:hypothetical protein